MVFSRARLQAIRVTVTLVEPSYDDESGLPSNWRATLKAAIVALGNSHGVGESVTGQRFFEPVFGIAGIREVHLKLEEVGNEEDNSWSSDETSGDGVIEILPGSRAEFSEANVVIEPEED